MEALIIEIGNPIPNGYTVYYIYDDLYYGIRTSDEVLLQKVKNGEMTQVAYEAIKNAMPIIDIKKE